MSPGLTHSVLLLLALWQHTSSGSMDMGAFTKAYTQSFEAALNALIALDFSVEVCPPLLHGFTYHLHIVLRFARQSQQLPGPSFWWRKRTPPPPRCDYRSCTGMRREAATGRTPSSAYATPS